MIRLLRRLVLGLLIIVIGGALATCLFVSISRWELVQYKESLRDSGESLDIAPGPSDEQIKAASELISVCAEIRKEAEEEKLPTLHVGNFLDEKGFATPVGLLEKPPGNPRKAPPKWEGLHDQFAAITPKIESVCSLILSDGPELHRYHRDLDLKLDSLYGFLVVAQVLNSSILIDIRERAPSPAIISNIEALLALGKVSFAQRHLLARHGFYFLLATQDVWQLLHSRKLTPEELSRLQLAFQSVDLLSSLPDYLRTQRASNLAEFTQPANSLPPGFFMTADDQLDSYGSWREPNLRDRLVLGSRRFAWSQLRYKDELHAVKTFQQLIDSCREAEKTNSYARVLSECRTLSGRLYPPLDQLISNIILGTAAEKIEQAVWTQTFVNMTKTAIAIDRYTQDHNVLPESLNELTPDYLPAIPPDLYDGQPLRYRKLDDSFQLYSIGPDGIDGGGDASREFPDKYPDKRRDIVWPRPIRAVMQ